MTEQKLLSALRERRLHLVESSCLTSTELTTPIDETENTIVHVAAEEGLLDQIPETLLTTSVLQAKTRYGDTPFHYAVGSGYISQVPSDLVTLANLTIPNVIGWTAFHCAAYAATLYLIPKKFITAETLAIPDKFGDTPLHLAANCLTQIPLDACTAKNISAANKRGETPLHDFARFRQLSHVPAKYLTEPNLTAQDFNGDRPIDLLHQYEEFYLIPRRILKPGVLLHKNGEGITPITQATYFNRLRQVQQTHALAARFEEVKKAVRAGLAAAKGTELEQSKLQELVIAAEAWLVRLARLRLATEAKAKQRRGLLARATNYPLFSQSTANGK